MHHHMTRIQESLKALQDLRYAIDDIKIKIKENAPETTQETIISVTETFTKMKTENILKHIDFELRDIQRTLYLESSRPETLEEIEDLAARHEDLEDPRGHL
jgi:hypothetical protein